MWYQSRSLRGRRPFDSLHGEWMELGAHDPHLSAMLDASHDRKVRQTLIALYIHTWVGWVPPTLTVSFFEYGRGARFNSYWFDSAL